jgi:molecular chaperone DnaK (HSP70)
MWLKMGLNTHTRTHTQVRVEIEALADGVDLSEPLTRARFEELNIDLFKKTMGPVKKVGLVAALRQFISCLLPLRLKPFKELSVGGGYLSLRMPYAIKNKKIVTRLVARLCPAMLHG